jgi:hypothetical protein
LPINSNFSVEKYQALFEEAVERTLKHGLCVPDVGYGPARILTSEFCEQFPCRAREVTDGINLVKLTLQCPLVHGLLLETIKDMLKTEVFLTIGWVWWGDSVEGGTRATLGKFDDGWIEELLGRSPSGEAAAAPHVWLTLPSMEIIDLSILSFLAIMHKRPDVMGSMITGHPDECPNGIHHVPMLVGDDFLRRTGMLAGAMTLH